MTMVQWLSESRKTQNECTQELTTYRKVLGHLEQYITKDLWNKYKASLQQEQQE